jgi:hypothetical protein
MTVRDQRSGPSRGPKGGGHGTALWLPVGRPQGVGTLTREGDAVRQLAVLTFVRRGHAGTIWHRSRYRPVWHAVPEALPILPEALCGARFSSEAQRTWEQVPAALRCHRCDVIVTTGLIEGLRTAEDATA